MKLSILIGTINGREEKLQRLMDVLSPQIVDDVEILINKDNKEISIGAKRRKLLEDAKGEYIVFIDDDDLVSSDYVEQILNHTGNDAIGFLIECTFEGRDKCLAKASSIYPDWAENKDGFKYVRSIYHKTPVKRELALKAGFDDERFGEDYNYSIRIMPFIKSESFINKILYFYQYEFEEHKKKYGIK